MKILTYPNPILETVAQKVSLPLIDEELSQIKEMWKTVQGIGVGLAAPQVGISKQWFIVHMGEDKDFVKKFKEVDFLVINPRFVFKSQKQVEMIEGCLSFPEEYWKIRRPEVVQIEFDTISNFISVMNKNVKPKYQKNKKLNATGWLSRIIQHEFDHLNGNVFIKMGGEKIKVKKS
jgi:peptide deformylase